MEPVVIYRTLSQDEIQLMRSRLEAAGIEAQIENEKSAAFLDVAVGGFRLVVAAENAEDAQNLLRDIRSS